MKPGDFQVGSLYQQRNCRRSFATELEGRNLEEFFSTCLQKIDHGKCRAESVCITAALATLKGKRLGHARQWWCNSYSTPRHGDFRSGSSGALWHLNVLVSPFSLFLDALHSQHSDSENNIPHWFIWDRWAFCVVTDRHCQLKACEINAWQLCSQELVISAR